jgi:Protein of unknown function (DUF1203)
MSNFRALPIETEVAQNIRRSGLDPFGGAAETWVVREPRLPCRHCLEEAPLHRKVLLVSYQPLQWQTPYAGRGPIFICADDCEAFDERKRVPEIVASRHVNLRAYDGPGKMLYAHSRLAKGEGAGQEIASMLEDDEVAEVHAHTALHGCFLCKFVRS